MPRHTYTTTLAFGTDGEPNYSEIEVKVSFSFTAGCAAQTYGPPERCWPAEPDEVADIEVIEVGGKPRPWDRGYGFLTDDQLAEMIVDRLETDDAHYEAMCALAAEDELAAREYRDEQRAERMREGF